MPGQSSGAGNQDDRRSCSSMMVLLPGSRCAANTRLLAGPGLLRSPELLRLGCRYDSGALHARGHAGFRIRCWSRQMGERSADDLRLLEAPCLVAHQNGMLHIAGALGANCPAPSAALPRLRCQPCGEHREDANTSLWCRGALRVRNSRQAAAVLPCGLGRRPNQAADDRARSESPACLMAWQGQSAGHVSESSRRDDPLRRSASL